jgi:hypothetical protein
LNAFLPWTSVLPVLGVEVHGAALPATVRCPLCQRQALGVYKDPSRRGEWYHCSGCSFAGDGVELTAAVGTISIGSAILKLAARGLPIPPILLEPERLDVYTKRVDAQRQAQVFWDAARASTADTGNTGPAQRKLGIAPGAMHAPEWPRRGGRFVGHCRVPEIEALLRSYVLNYRRKQGKHNIGGVGWNPLFVGPGWRDLLVIAYQDVLGRISGFLLIGREARWPEDFVFAPARHRRDGRVWTTGVTMLETALPLHREFADTIFVIDDPVLAVRLQLRHLAASDTPLPVAGAWGRPEAKSIWPCLPRRNLVHWSPEPDGRLIARARASGGRVALTPAGTAVSGHLERSRPIQALRGMLTAARPWDAALEALLARLAPAKAEELVLGLKLQPDETAGFLRTCADDTRARLSALLADAGKPRGVTISGKTVVESGGAWRVAKSGELVCDAVLRIAQVIRAANGGVSYRGSIEYRGQSLPFWAPDTEIEKDPLRWLRTKVGQAGLGEVLIGSIYWSKHLLTIAQQLEPPRSVRGLDAVGWDDDRNAFALPRFLLRGNGDVAVPDYVVPPEAVLPAAGLAPPEGLAPGARVALAWGDEANELFWAVATCLLTDILAPALGLQRTSTALVGVGAIAAGQATARAFGCLEVPVGYDSAQQVAAETRRLLGAGHRWPLLARRRDNETTRTIHVKSLSMLPPGMIAAVGQWPAAVLSLSGGWHVVTCDHTVNTERIREHGAAILTNYLKDLCARRLSLEPEGNLLDAVHADLVAWYGRAQATPRPVERARQHLSADDPAARGDRFGRMVARLIAAGDLHLTTPTANAQHAIILLGNDQVHIPKWEFIEGVAKKRTPVLDVDALSAQLRTSQVLLAERDQDYVAGWIVSERWLRQRMDDLRREDQPGVSLVK